MIAAARIAAQPPAAAPKVAPTQTPAPATTYKPDFEIPKPHGSGQSRSEPSASSDGYVIGPQDNLSIIVTDEADLTGKYRVDTDGTISMPYLSRVPVAGLSLAEAQDKITAMLKKDFLRNPQVRIEVDQFKARSVLMTGEVRQQGKVTLPGTTMSLLEALALAGSATQNASNEVLIMHPPKPGEKAPEPIVVNRQGSGARQGRPRHHAAGRRHRQRAGRASGSTFPGSSRTRDPSCSTPARPSAGDRPGRRSHRSRIRSAPSIIRDGQRQGGRSLASSSKTRCSRTTKSK